MISASGLVGIGNNNCSNNPAGDCNLEMNGKLSSHLEGKGGQYDVRNYISLLMQRKVRESNNSCTNIAGMSSTLNGAGLATSAAAAAPIAPQSSAIGHLMNSSLSSAQKGMQCSATQSSSATSVVMNSAGIPQQSHNSATTAASIIMNDMISSSSQDIVCLLKTYEDRERQIQQMRLWRREFSNIASNNNNSSNNNNGNQQISQSEQQSKSIAESVTHAFERWGWMSTSRSERARVESEEHAMKKYFNIKADEATVKSSVFKLINAILATNQANYHAFVQQGFEFDANDLLHATTRFKEDIQGFIYKHSFRLTTVLHYITAFSRQRYSLEHQRVEAILKRNQDRIIVKPARGISAARNPTARAATLQSQHNIEKQQIQLIEDEFRQSSAVAETEFDEAIAFNDAAAGEGCVSTRFSAAKRRASSNERVRESNSSAGGGVAFLNGKYSRTEKKKKQGQSQIAGQSATNNQQSNQRPSTAGKKRLMQPIGIKRMNENTLQVLLPQVMIANNAQAGSAGISGGNSLAGLVVRGGNGSVVSGSNNYSVSSGGVGGATSEGFVVNILFFPSLHSAISTSMTTTVSQSKLKTAAAAAYFLNQFDPQIHSEGGCQNNGSNSHFTTNYSLSNNSLSCQSTNYSASIGSSISNNNNNLVMSNSCTNSSITPISQNQLNHLHVLPVFARISKNDKQRRMLRIKYADFSISNLPNRLMKAVQPPVFNTQQHQSKEERNCNHCCSNEYNFCQSSNCCTSKGEMSQKEQQAQHRIKLQQYHEQSTKVIDETFYLLTMQSELLFGVSDASEFKTAVDRLLALNLKSNSTIKATCATYASEMKAAQSAALRATQSMLRDGKGVISRVSNNAVYEVRSKYSNVSNNFSSHMTRILVSFSAMAEAGVISSKDRDRIEECSGVVATSAMSSFRANGDQIGCAAETGAYIDLTNPSYQRGDTCNLMKCTDQSVRKLLNLPQPSVSKSKMQQQQKMNHHQNHSLRSFTIESENVLHLKDPGVPHASHSIISHSHSISHSRCGSAELADISYQQQQGNSTLALVAGAGSTVGVPSVVVVAAASKRKTNSKKPCSAKARKTTPSTSVVASANSQNSKSGITTSTTVESSSLLQSAGSGGIMCSGREIQSISLSAGTKKLNSLTSTSNPSLLSLSISQQPAAYSLSHTLQLQQQPSSTKMINSDRSVLYSRFDVISESSIVQQQQQNQQLQSSLSSQHQNQFSNVNRYAPSARPATASMAISKRNTSKYAHTEYLTSTAGIAAISTIGSSGIAAAHTITAAEFNNDLLLLTPPHSDRFITSTGLKHHHHNSLQISAANNGVAFKIKQQSGVPFADTIIKLTSKKINPVGNRRYSKLSSHIMQEITPTSASSTTTTSSNNNNNNNQP